MNHRALILSCTKTKKPIRGHAIDVYDGPTFRVLRNYISVRDDIDIYIISAKYGVIPSDHIIEPYDKVLDTMTAIKMKDEFGTLIKDIFDNHDEVAICAGKTYRLVVDGYQYISIEGSIGEMISGLKRWLYSKQPDKSESITDWVK